MPILDYAIKDSILTVSPETTLKNIILLLNEVGDKTCKDGLYCKKFSFGEQLSENQIIRYPHCIFVMDKKQLLGVFTIADALRLMASEVNLASFKIAEVMRQPVISLPEDFDVNTALYVMREHNLYYLSIFNDERELLGIVTPESIAAGLQIELAKNSAELSLEIAQRRSLELALDESEKKLEKRVEQETEELVKANKLLQRAICDRIATEAQLLQTTSELQEIFQAFPDIYFRLASDGTILTYHARDTSDLYLTPEVFLGKRGQDIMPPLIAQEVQQAIDKVNETNSLVAIEYSLILPKGETSFEARFFPSIQHQIIVIIRNITERKQAQAALETAKEELEIRVEKRTCELSNINERLRQEIIERQRIEEALRYRVEFEKLITTISTHFINLAPDEIDNGINQALQSIGEFVNVDRSYVFLFNDNQNRIHKTYGWCANKQDKIHTPKEISVKIVPWAMEKLRRFETIHIPCVKDFITEASSENIQSLIILPIVCSGLLIGYLEFDSVINAKIWTEESIALLKMVGEMLGNALERKRVEQALRISEERYTQAISAGKVGIWEWNIQTNEIYIAPNMKAMLGYTEQEISNQFDDWLKFIHPDDIELVKVEINAYLECLIPKYEIEHRILHKNGSYLWFLARGRLLRNAKDEPCFIAGSNTDITASKQAEFKLKTSLKEKEVLLKEIHHRVKNNLQIISSLLRLQAGYIKDEQALEIFQDSQNRVRAMALIHENLYQSSDLASIDFSDYIRKLTNNLLRSYGINHHIKIHLNIHKSLLRIDTAIPCGLIINELICNSLKHAFSHQTNGEIYVDFFHLGQGKYSLNVSDNGVGFLENIELRQNQSLGLQLVWNLVEQLEGSIAFHTSLGTLFQITFVEPS